MKRAIEKAKKEYLENTCVIKSAGDVAAYRSSLVHRTHTNKDLLIYAATSPLMYHN